MKKFYSEVNIIAAPICRIIGAGRFESGIFKENPGDCIIAADGGLKYLENMNIKPNVIVGDFDSYTRNPPENIETICFPVEKDDTDMFLAAKTGLGRGYRYFAVYGGLGGKRISHSLANIALLEWICTHNCQGFIVDEFAEITAIRNGYIEYNHQNEGNISVFAYGGNADGVSISGFKYETENVCLTSGFPLGISNSFTGNNAKIACENGTLIIVRE